MYELLTRKRPPPRDITVDSSGFLHSAGGEWFSVRLKKCRRRRFHALHNAVDTDTLMIHATRVRTRSGGDPRFMVLLVRRIQKSNLATVYCDKTYISRRNVQFIANVDA
ncbi:MAG: transposase [Candidatus Thorarchaeota archaeon]